MHVLMMTEASDIETGPAAAVIVTTIRGERG